jgi:hypothetical protein
MRLILAISTKDEIGEDELRRLWGDWKVTKVCLGASVSIR